MRIYTFSEARQKLASLLDKVRLEGEVRIRRKDGTVYAIKQVKEEVSPLEAAGIRTTLTAEEIVEYVREGRERETGPYKPARPPQKRKRERTKSKQRRPNIQGLPTTQRERQEKQKTCALGQRDQHVVNCLMGRMRAVEMVVDSFSPR